MMYHRRIPPRWRTVTLMNMLQPRCVCPLFVASLMFESPTQVLFGLSTRGTLSHPLGLHNMSKKLIDRSVQTECEPPIVFPSKTKNKVGRPRKVSFIAVESLRHLTRSQHPEQSINVPGRTASSMTSESATTSSNVTASTVRRKQMSQHVIPKPSSRALRSRSRNTNMGPSNGVLLRVWIYFICR